MSLFVLSPDTVWNPSLLKFSTAPRKILQRGTVLPRRDVSWGFLARTIFENQLLRFSIILLPFLAAGFIWPQLALPLGSAPIFMLIAIGFVEMRLLRTARHKREGLVSEAEAARALDTLQFRGRRILAELAARRGIENGVLYLVVEQSDMARIPPLTIVSLQLDEGKSRLSPLSAEERALIREGLFDEEFTEAQLLLANLRDDLFLRSVMYEARAVSAHARLAAYLNQPETVS
ncbi:MAG: hypothetical protein OXC60_11530 [Litoreibacter sp.]|nr:hypothetical protein [Litoreibacter sp.]MCY4335283.1 hypothetical protein [Litoreibacter sp.]